MIIENAQLLVEGVLWQKIYYEVTYSKMVQDCDSEKIRLISHPLGKKLIVVQISNS